MQEFMHVLTMKLHGLMAITDHSHLPAIYTQN